MQYLVERYYTHAGAGWTGWVLIGCAAESLEQAKQEADAALASDPKHPVRVREVASRVVYERCSEAQPLSH